MDPQELARELRAQIVQMLDTSLIDGQRVRMFAVGPNRHFDALHLWASDRWQSHWEPYDADALAGLSLGDWLSDIDALEHECHGRPATGKKIPGFPVRFLDNPWFEEQLQEKLEALEIGLREALRSLAKEPRLHGLPGLPGLFSCRLSSRDSAELVAFCHPQGHHDLWPVRDKGPRQSSCYHWAALCEEGLVSFYPKGEDDVQGAEPHAAFFGFEDMTMIREASGSDGVAFRYKDELLDREYEAGLTRDPGPDSEAICRALREHFSKPADLFFDPRTFPKVEDEVAVERWFSHYESCNVQSGAQVIAQLFEEQGLEAARGFLARQREDRRDRPRTLLAFAEQLSQAEHHEECLSICETLEGKNRGQAGRHELTALLGLQRWEDLLSHYAQIIAQDPSYENYLAPWKALALTELGFASEAIELLEPLTDRKASKRWREDCYFALAHALYGEDPDAACDALHLGLQSGTPYLARQYALYFKDRPALLAIMEQRAQLQSRRDAFGDALKSRRLETTAPLLEVEEVEDLLPNATHKWLLSQVISLEQFGALSKIVRSGEGLYFKVSSQGILLAKVDGLAGSELEATLHAPEQSYYADFALQHPYIFAANRALGPEVIDISCPTAPRSIFANRPLFNDGQDTLALGEGLLAVGGWRVDIYDIQNPQEPVLVSTLGDGSPGVESSHYPAFHFKGSILFLTSQRHGLLAVDLSQPEHPKLLSATALERGISYGKLHIAEDIALVALSGSRTWLLDISDPSSPRSLGLLGFSFDAPPLKMGAALILLEDERVWTLDLSSPAHPVVGVELRSKGDDEAFVDLELDLHGAALLDERQLLILCDEQLQVFQREARTPLVQHFEQSFAMLCEPLLEAVEGKLQAFARENPGASLGLLCLDRWHDVSYSCTALEPHSSLGLYHAFGESEHRWSFSLDELLPGSQEAEDAEGYDQEREKAKARAWRSTARALFQRLQSRDIFLSLASGRVYLAVSHDYGIDILETFHHPTRDWLPFRSALIEQKPPTLEQMLTGANSHKYLNAIEETAREDAKTRRMLLEFAGSHREARAVLYRLSDEWEEEVLEAFLSISKSRGLEPEYFDLFARHLERPEVQAELEGGYREGPARAQVKAAVLLGRCEEDRMLGLARQWLQPDNRSHMALLDELLQGMEQRLPELKGELLAWVEGADTWTHDLPMIATHLFRAGHRSLPDAVAQQAKGKKYDEQFHGESSVFGDDFSQHPACKAERLWTGWMLAQRVRMLKDAEDASSPVWPPELPLERNLNSWGYVLQAAEEHLAKDDTLDFFESLLKQRATPEPKYLPERNFLRWRFRDALRKQSALAAIEWGETILNARPGSFDSSALQSVEKQLFYARLMRGWELLKERQLEQAAGYGQAALAERPNDAQALFFDARLTWLTRSIPDAMQKVEEYLKRISQQDKVGNARLLNLYGCALDELHRHEEAIPWFERAVQAQPDEALYLANIAECYDKLQQPEKAVKWAQRALKRGADTAIVRNIIAGLPNAYTSNS